MKSTNQKSEKHTINKYYLLMVLATSIGFAQTEKSTQEIVKAKSDLSSAKSNTNPYYKNNELAGEMVMISNDGNVEGIDDWQTQSAKALADVSSEPTQITKTRTKSNQTNERNTKPNGQDDGNPFPPKSSISNVLKTKHDTAKNSVGNIR